MGKEFWKAAFIRAAHTWLQAFLSAIPTTAAVLSDVNWKVALSAATLAAVISLGKSVIVGLPEVKLTDTLYALDNDPPEEDEDFDDDDCGDEGEE